MESGGKQIPHAPDRPLKTSAAAGALPVRAPRRIVRAMVDTVPLTASGPRAPAKPKPIPRPIREMIRLMVVGRPGDEDFAPVPFLDAARLCGISGDRARKHLDRPAVRQLLMSERRAWRAAISSGNEGTLLRIREKSPNSMAQLGAGVRMLEELDSGPSGRGGGGQVQQAGFVIVIAVPPPAPSVDGPASPSLTIIDASPSPPGQGGPPSAGY